MSDVKRYLIFKSQHKNIEDLRKKGSIVVASGYFNPLHNGHLDYLEAAKKLGDSLIVIINNDDQVKTKGSCPFQDEVTRCRIVGALKCVDLAVVAIDQDKEIIETLIDLRPNIFANGGPMRHDYSTELKICEELGCNYVVGVGGVEKSNESRQLLRKAYLHQYEQYVNFRPHMVYGLETPEEVVIEMEFYKNNPPPMFKGNIGIPEIWGS